MPNPYRVKTYRFPQLAGSATTMVQFSDTAINGELLRVTAAANFTGSVIIQESGTNLTFCNYTATSGTNVFQPFSFTTTTGSFVTQSPLRLQIGSLASGTAIVYGPIDVLYR